VKLESDGSIRVGIHRIKLNVLGKIKPRIFMVEGDIMVKKNAVIITIFLLLYIMFSRNTVSEVVGGASNINIDSKLEVVSRKSNIDLNPEKFSDHYIDRVTTFRNMENNKGEIIFLGDSLIEICEWSELFNNALIKNRGISGDNTYGVLNRLEEITEARPSKIFMMVGINDIGKCRPTQSIIDDYEKIFNKIKADSPNTKIYVHSVLPINKEKFITHTKVEEILNLNSALSKVCDKLQVEYINLYPLFVVSDNKLNSQYTTAGIHLNGDGYLMWKEAIKDLCK
jgi:lysophospholipase L1-like esterase